jgi:hypothetical protein
VDPDVLVADVLTGAAEEPEEELQADAPRPTTTANVPTRARRVSDIPAGCADDAGRTLRPARR